MKSPLSDHICAVCCVYRAKRAPRLIHPVGTLSCIVSYLFLLFLWKHGPFFTPHRQPSASCWRCAADTRFKLEQSRWAAHAASTPRACEPAARHTAGCRRRTSHGRVGYSCRRPRQRARAVRQSQRSAQSGGCGSAAAAVDLTVLARAGTVRRCAFSSRLSCSGCSFS